MIAVILSIFLFSNLSFCFGNSVQLPKLECEATCEPNEMCGSLGVCICKPEFEYVFQNKKLCETSNISSTYPTIKFDETTRISFPESLNLQHDEKSTIEKNLKSTTEKNLETTVKKFDVSSGKQKISSNTINDIKTSSETKSISTNALRISTTKKFLELLEISSPKEKPDVKKYIKSKCDFHRQCGVNEVCPHGICECEQNHRYNHKYDCISFKCNTDLDCNEHDSYSYCRKNQCQCRDDSYYDYQTGRCIPIQNCSSEKECHNNQTCQRSICKCKLNYKWNFTVRRCLYSGCEEDIDCFISDEHNCKCLKSHNCSCNKKIDTQVEQNKSMNNFEFKFNVFFSVLILLFLQFVK
jgi:hypothetical protein